MGEPIDEHMEDTAAPGPSLIDVRAPEGWGEGTAISARVAASSPWPPGGAAAAAPRVDTANRGDGTAVVAVARAGPGEHVIELTAAGPRGTATEIHTLRILPPAPGPPGPGPALAVLLGGEPAGAVIDLAASPEPAELELRATDPGGGDIRFLVRAAGPAGGDEPPWVSLDDRGDGTAALRVDRGEPGEAAMDVAAVGAPGAAWSSHLVRVLPLGPGLFGGGLWIRPPLAELPMSAGPALLEARAVGGGEASARALRSAHWGAGEAPEPPRVEALGGGAAAVVVDASAPGEHLVEVSAAGRAELYVIRVLPVRDAGG